MRSADRLLHEGELEGVAVDHDAQPTVTPSISRALLDTVAPPLGFKDQALGDAEHASEGRRRDPQMEHALHTHAVHPPLRVTLRSVPGSGDDRVGAAEPLEHWDRRGSHGGRGSQGDGRWWLDASDGLGNERHVLERATAGRGPTC